MKTAKYLKIFACCAVMLAATLPGKAQIFPNTYINVDWQMGVPLGNLTGWMLFSGLGPKLRVSIDSVGDVVAEVRNQFDSAGINQTHHQVLMDLSVTVHLFIPGEVTSVTVDTTMCLAETILIGTVPNSYLQTGSIP